jgi:hypothetical protein
LADLSYSDKGPFLGERRIKATTITRDPRVALPARTGRESRVDLRAEMNTKRRMELAEENCLARAIYFHIGDAARTVKFDFAKFLLARVKSPDYPETMCGVVYQGSNNTENCQFAFTCDGVADNVTDKILWEDAKYVAQVALWSALPTYPAILETFPSDRLRAPHALESLPRTETEVPARTLAGMSARTVCRIALAADKQNWDAMSRYELHIKDAVSRGLTPEDCRAIIGSN